MIRSEQKFIVSFKNVLLWNCLVLPKWKLLWLLSQLRLWTLNLVPDHNWDPDFFGPQEIWYSKNFGPHEIWAPRNLVPRKFGPCMKIIIWHFYAGTKLLGAQICQGPNFLGTKKVRGPNEIGDHFSHSQSGESVKFIKKSDSRLRCLHALCTWPQVLAGMCPPVHHWGFWLSGQHHYLYCLKRTGM